VSTGNLLKDFRPSVIVGEKEKFFHGELPGRKELWSPVRYLPGERARFRGAVSCEKPARGAGFFLLGNQVQLSILRSKGKHFLGMPLERVVG